MITDIIQGLNSNHKVQSSMLKVQRINSSMLKVQRINSSMVNVQISKDKKFNVQSSMIKVQEGFAGLEKFVVCV